MLGRIRRDGFWSDDVVLTTRSMRPLFQYASISPDGPDELKEWIDNHRIDARLRWEAERAYRGRPKR